MDSDEFRRQVEARLRETEEERRLEERKRLAAKNKKRKKKKKKKIIIITILVIVAIISIIAGVFIFKINKMFNNIQRVDSAVSKQSDIEKKLNNGEVVNILLIGQDKRDYNDKNQRSDSMIVCSINPQTNTMSFLSMMRDMYVDISDDNKDYGRNKLNAAYSFGGIDLLDSTLMNNFDFNLDGNISVDFSGFITAISPLAPIDIKLTAAEAEYMNNNTNYGSTRDKADAVWHLKEGVNSLTAEQLLAYSRIRYVGNSDWDRTSRQRTVLMKAFEKLKSASLTDKLSVVEKMTAGMTWDGDNSELVAIAKTLINKNMKIKSYQIPVEGTYSTDSVSGVGSVLVPDLSANKTYIKEYMYGKENSSN